MNEPDLLLLDEPLQGCDPLARSSIMNVIRDLAGRGVTILITSHILAEIERITEQVIILHNGRVLALGGHRIHDDRSSTSILTSSMSIVTSRSGSARRCSNCKVCEGLRFPSEGVLRQHP